MRDLFMLDEDLVFLNHGSFGACPREVFEVYQGWQRELERNPVEFLGRRSSTLLAVARERLGEFLGADPDCLVFVTNATTGVNTVARSLEFQPGDEILTTDHEYGACDNVWEFVCRRSGARYVRHRLPLPLPEPHALADSLWQSVTPRTRLIYLSHITSTTALILPVEEVCRRARAAGILTLIDGAHAPGQLPLDLDGLAADFYTGNCHKWLCAPKGAGFLYTRPEHHERLDAAVISWGYSHTVTGHTSFDAYTGSTPYVRKHQWQGSRDIAAFLAVPAAIDFRARHDWPRVIRKCHRLAVQILARVGALTGLAPISGPSAFAQMVAVPLPAADPDRLKDTLFTRYRIEVPLTTHEDRLFVRPSFQGYNTPAEADALVAALGEIYHSSGSPTPVF
mgnify:CR=1 FL=1